MGMPAAKEGDQVIGQDIHVVLVPQPTGPPVPTPLPHPFKGVINGNLSKDVKIMSKAAATVDSIAENQPAHVPTPPGTAFQTPPKNRGVIRLGSLTVKINGKAATRNGDGVETCNDPVDALTSKIVAQGTVLIG